MNREQMQTRKISLKEAKPDVELKTTTASERMAMVWEITKDTWAFRGEKVAESRLSRHVVCLERRTS